MPLSMPEVGIALTYSGRALVVDLVILAIAPAR
jgi:hypothetical protein